MTRVIAGRYELGREIGRGGMGAVWLAHDTTLGREVAVKRLGLAPGGGSDRDLERAGREARLAARLNHAHVVHVFDLVHEDDAQWLVMEYVEGRTLAALIRQEGALEHDRASALVGQAADALGAAHAAGIVHRDVKPSNILVGADDVVKLSDFGIARAEADPTLTQTGLVTGSPAYLSPEVASGHMATTASDVWSLGATLFHALSGQPPYEVGENLMGALFRIVHEDPPRLDDPGWLAPLLEATMTKDPAERWSMAQVRDFLHSSGRRGGPALPTTEDRTQVMTPPVVPAPTPPTTPAAEPTPVAPEPVPEPAPEPAPAPAPTAARQTAAPRSRRRAGWLPVALVAAVVVLVALVVWTVTRDDGASPTIDRPVADDGSSTSSGPRPSDDATTTSPAAPAGPTRAGMEGFVTDYLATAPSSPETTYEMLSPAFQRASGGLESYSGYWSTIAEADPVEISADPEDLVVQYTVDYTRQDGSQVTDEVELRLQFDDGRYLIADEV